jgi:hypothetical protein
MRVVEVVLGVVRLDNLSLRELLRGVGNPWPHGNSSVTEYR